MIIDVALPLQVVRTGSRRQYRNLDGDQLHDLLRRYRSELADPDSAIPKAYALAQIAELHVEAAIRSGVPFGGG
jgi:hypothetical protein